MASLLDTTIGDDRAHALPADYHARFRGVAELPLPVQSHASDLLGLRIVEPPIEGSGVLYPPERLVVHAAESAVHGRFTLAHEIGHWREARRYEPSARQAPLQPSPCRRRADVRAGPRRDDFSPCTT
ncbi:MAG: hypothetical protein ACJ77E_06665 [Gaiellaceae bacterium]